MATLHPVAIVTGGARRIGRAIVEDLAAHGWAVAIHFHSARGDAEELAAAIAARGGKAMAVGCDFAKGADVGSLIGTAAAALGPAVLLVNNASTFEKDTVGALDPARWERQMAVNLTAPVFLAEAFAGALPDGAEGNVVNLLDQRIWRTTPRDFSYQVSKSALHAATVTLAQALAPRVRVNGIAPGPALPNIRQDEERFRRKVAGVPLGRGPALAEFGATVRYLVETRSITGQVIGLDGGQHLAWRTGEGPLDG
jgi:NAD(P)-dependent dehydrogenase (short-subunit alcohol dehydrogenase family)